MRASRKRIFKRYAPPPALTIAPYPHCGRPPTPLRFFRGRCILPPVRISPLLPLIVTLAFTGCASGPKAPPTLCQLAEAREAYAGQRLTVEGYLLVGGHGSTVSDPRCGYGVGIAWYRDEPPSMRAFAAVARRSQWEPMMVRVRVTGEMKREREPGPAGERTWYLDLSAAEVLSARPLPDVDRERYLIWLEGPSPAPFRPSR